MISNTHIFKLGSIALLILVGAISAQASILVNGDFETDAYPTNSYVSIPSSGSLTGWSVIGPANGDVAGIGAGYLGAPSQEIDLSGAHDVAGSGIAQTLTTTVGQTYVVDFSIYTDGNVNPAYAGKVMGLIDGNDMTGDLQSDPTSFARASESFAFTAASTSTVLSFISDSTANVAHIDNISVNAVPEPCSLIAVAGLAVAGFRRRKN